MGAYYSTYETVTDKETLKKIKTLSYQVVDLSKEKIKNHQKACVKIEKSSIIIAQLKLLAEIRIFNKNKKFPLFKIKNLEGIVHQNLVGHILDIYKDNFNYQLRSAALRMKIDRSLSKQIRVITENTESNKMCLNAICLSPSCLRKHVKPLDDYTLNYYTARNEAKKSGISLWVYFAQRYKQPML
jgi:hypothetical protein